MSGSGTSAQEAVIHNDGRRRREGDRRGVGGATHGGGKMAQLSDTLLDRMVQKIVEEVDPDQVILFGSRARGDARAESDVDLVVVESEPFGQERSRRLETARLYRSLAGFGVAKDILLYSRDEVEYWRDSLNHVLARALREGRTTFREGRVLYERR